MMASMDTGKVRSTAARSLDRATSAVTRRVVSASSGAADEDLLIADHLRRRTEPLADPAAWVTFLRDAYRAQTHDVLELKAWTGAPDDERHLRLRTLLDVLTHGVPALGSATAERIANASDALLADRTPFVRPAYAADVGHHSNTASSGAAQARMLTAVVRFMAARSVIEIGTAYGLGTLTLAMAAGPDARIVSAERSEPQLGLARRLLVEAPTVTVVQAIAADSTAEVTGALGRPADLFFHDGAHSREAYIEDFAAYEPHLAPGALVVFDDIDWTDERFHPNANTYAGWQAVAAHRRVSAAAEIDHNWGLLLLE